MRILLLISIFWWGWGMSFAQENRLNLEEVIRLGIDKSLDIQEAKRAIRQGILDYELLQAGGNFQLALQSNLPSFYKSSSRVVQPDGGVSFRDVIQNSSSIGLVLSKKIIQSNTSLYLETNALRFDDFANKAVGYNTVPLRLGVRQEIHTFNADKWNLSLLPKRIATRKVVADSKTLAQQLQLTRAYFELIRADVEQEIAQTNLTNNEKILQVAEERYKLGKVSLGDLTQVKLNVSRSRQSSASAKRNRATALLALQTTMDYYEAMKVEIPKDLPEIHIENMDSVVAVLWEKNADKALLDMAHLEQDMEQDRVTKEYGYQAQISASIGLVKSGESLKEVYQKPQSEVLVNVSLFVPLVDGGQKKIAQEKVQVERDVLAQKSQYLQQQFEQRFKQLVLRIQQQKQEVSLSKEALTLARKSYKIARDRYQLGNISVTELTISANDRDQAWRNYIYTLSQCWVLYYEVKALGY